MFRSNVFDVCHKNIEKVATSEPDPVISKPKQQHFQSKRHHVRWLVERQLIEGQQQAPNGRNPRPEGPGRFPNTSCRQAAAHLEQLGTCQGLASGTRLSGDSGPFTKWAVSTPGAPCCGMVAHGLRVGARPHPGRERWV